MRRRPGRKKIPGLVRVCVRLRRADVDYLRKIATRGGGHYQTYLRDVVERGVQAEKEDMAADVCVYQASRKNPDLSTVPFEEVDKKLGLGKKRRRR